MEIAPFLAKTIAVQWRPCTVSEAMVGTTWECLQAPCWGSRCRCFRQFFVRPNGCVWKCCVPLNQWFCLSLSLLNGYFIGNIPYFQTNPNHFNPSMIIYIIIYIYIFLLIVFVVLFPCFVSPNPHSVGLKSSCSLISFRYAPCTNIYCTVCPQISKL